MRLFAVGDDWQSIYRFAGADIGSISRFAEHFGVTATVELDPTFRMPDRLTDRAAAFVQRNPAQTRRRIKAASAAFEPVVHFRWHPAATHVDGGPDGSFWVGTMQNNLHPDGSAKPMTGATGALYRVRHDGGITREVDGIGLSNTLAWTDGGKTLLFADTATGIIKAYAIEPDGRLGEARVFSDGTSNGEQLPGHCDGSAIDAEGYLWNARFAGSCLIRFRPDGTVDRTIDLPVTNPTSCCFGGPDLTTLYVTSARHGLDAAALARNPHEGALLAIETGIKGTPSVKFAG